MKIKFPALRKIAWASVAVLSTGILLTSCLKNSDDTTNNNSSTSAGLMAFNLAPDQASVGFALSGNSLTTSPLGFNNYTGAYLPVYPGSRSIVAFNFNTGDSLATASGNFELGKYYSVFLVGNGSTLENLVVPDDVDSLMASGQAFVRYINAISDASSPAVTVTASGTNVLSGAAAFKTVSAFVPVAPGSIDIKIDNGGTINATRTVTVEQNKVYTVLLIGKAGGTGDSAVQIKYVENGTVNNTANRISSTAANRAIH